MNDSWGGIGYEVINREAGTYKIVSTMSLAYKHRSKHTS